MEDSSENGWVWIFDLRKENSLEMVKAKIMEPWLMMESQWKTA